MTRASSRSVRNANDASSLVRPEGLRSVEAFLAELWPASLQRLKSAVEAGDAG